MDSLVPLLTGGNLWQIVLAIIVVVAGSSAVSAWITGSFESNRFSKSFRRDVRASALAAIGDAYALYLRYGNQSTPSLIDEKRDQEVATASAVLRARVAAVGDENLLLMAQQLVLQGESFASQDEEVGLSLVESTFTTLITAIAKTIPAK